MNRSLGNGFEMQVGLPVDDRGLLGRQCPACNGFFKVEFGTGLQEEGVPCHCPYCGHTADQSEFWTNDQIDYVTAMISREIEPLITKELKKFERKPDPKALIGIGIEVGVKIPPIKYYDEPDLETEVICDNCSLHYSIYGVFGFCPDCAIHNSLQIFAESLLVLKKTLSLASQYEQTVADVLVSNALEDGVSAFDGFGRETCRVHAQESQNPGKAESISFQNIDRAKELVQALFGFDITHGLDSSQWELAVRCFQKRHLLAHKMGVVNEGYINKSGDTTAVIGRKIGVQAEEVIQLAEVLGIMAENLASYLEKKP